MLLLLHPNGELTLFLLSFQRGLTECVLLGPHPFELLLDWHLFLDFEALVHCQGSHRVSAIRLRKRAYSSALGTDLVLLVSSFGAFFLFELLLYLCPREEGKEPSEELGIFAPLI